MTRNDVMEAVGGAVFLALLFALMMLFAWLTPPQLSAEADRSMEASEAAGVEYMPYKGGER